MSRGGPPQVWSRGDPVTAERLNRMAGDSVRDVREGPGIKVTRLPNGVLIISARPEATARTAGQFFTARITSKTQDGTNKRWTYAVTEQEKTGAAWSGWADKAGGRTGNAYNKAEEQNGATGLYGNGVDSANLVGTFALQPIPTGRLVDIEEVRRTDNGATEFWFTEPNGIDGACT